MVAFDFVYLSFQLVVDVIFSSNLSNILLKLLIYLLEQSNHFSWTVILFCLHCFFCSKYCFIEQSTF